MSENVHDAVVGILMIGGALMSLAAAVGLMRFPDLMSRMHAASKPQVLGLLLFLSAMAVEFGRLQLLPVLLLCWILMLLTAPVSAHMVGRAGYRTKHLRPELLSIDELDDVVERAQRYITEAQEAEEDEDPQIGDGPYTGDLRNEDLAAARGQDQADGSRSRRRLEG